MAQFSPEQIAHYQAQANADPAVQRIVAQMRARGGVRTSAGIEAFGGQKPEWLPDGLSIEARTGQVVEGRNFPKEALLAQAGIIGGGALGAAFGGAGGAAGGSAAGGGIPTIPSTAFGTGMGYGPASLAGTSALAGGSAAIPTLASRAIGSGMGSDPASLAGTSALGGAGLAGLGQGAGSRLLQQAGESTGNSLIDQLIKTGIAGLAGLPGLMGNNGPTESEQQTEAAIRRLLQQQEDRTKYADPLYKATMQMAYGLLPQRQGNYPGGE